MLDFLKNIDTCIFLFINRHNCKFLDIVMWQISDKYIWIPLYLAILGFIIYKYRKLSWIVLSGMVLMIFLSDQISSGIIKNMVERLRPSHDPVISGIVHIVKDYRGGKFGFVSSHAANCFALAIFTYLLFRKRFYSLGIFTWAAIVSFSRIYLGVHYPGDIIGGALVGIVSGLFVFYIVEKFIKNKNNFSVKPSG